MESTLHEVMIRARLVASTLPTSGYDDASDTVRMNKPNRFIACFPGKVAHGLLGKRLFHVLANWVMTGLNPKRIDLESLKGTHLSIAEIGT